MGDVPLALDLIQCGMRRYKKKWEELGVTWDYPIQLGTHAVIYSTTACN